MFLIQQTLEKTEAYKTGYKFGQWVYHNQILAIILGILFSILIVFLFVKVIKGIRNFGE